jgi:uncharacterized protein YbjT (DUF2867 family)
MKYAITGSAGTISQPLVEGLLNAGHQVTVLGRDASRLAGLVSAGATPAIGSVEDIEFVTRAFQGADAVYTMVPPNFVATDWIGFIEQVGRSYAAAISANNIKYVVNLSSVGGHLPEGAGPVSGLHRVEELLNKLEGINVKHLRPAYFYHNLLNMTGMIKSMGIIGSNFGGNGGKLTMVHPADIAKAAIEELLQLNFTGHSVRYVAGDERTGTEIAAILGSAIGKNDLPWVEFTDEQALQGMLQARLPQEQASKYVEMGASLRTGKMAEDLQQHPVPFSGVTLEQFSREFAASYMQP